MGLIGEDGKSGAAVSAGEPFGVWQIGSFNKGTDHLRIEQIDIAGSVKDVIAGLCGIHNIGIRAVAGDHLRSCRQRGLIEQPRQTSGPEVRSHVRNDSSRITAGPLILIVEHGADACLTACPNGSLHYLPPFIAQEFRDQSLPAVEVKTTEPRLFESPDLGCNLRFSQRIIDGIKGKRTKISGRIPEGQIIHGGQISAPFPLLLSRALVTRKKNEREKNKTPAPGAAFYCHKAIPCHSKILKPGMCQMYDYFILCKRYHIFISNFPFFRPLFLLTDAIRI